jgi:hypothetical protein
MWKLRILSGALVALSIFYVYHQGKKAGEYRIQSLWDAEKLLISNAQKEQAAKAREVEQELQAQLASQRVEHEDEVRRIVRNHNALVNSLRNRTERPESVADVPEDSPFELQPLTGCTGKELYREDGTFLVGEAARADQLRIALQACIADRIEIERTLNQLSP